MKHEHEKHHDVHGDKHHDGHGAHKHNKHEHAKEHMRHVKDESHRLRMNHAKSMD